MSELTPKDFLIPSDEAEKALGLPAGYLVASKKFQIPYSVGPDWQVWVWASDVIVALRSASSRDLAARPKLENAQKEVVPV